MNEYFTAPFKTRYNSSPRKLCFGICQLKSRGDSVFPKLASPAQTHCCSACQVSIVPDKDHFKGQLFSAQEAVSQTEGLQAKKT